jgi:hypothetical protein
MKKQLFFIFKGWEFFNVASVNELFKRYGSFTFSDFLKETKNQEKKYITIDSAEKLSELENVEVFKEFLKRLVQSGWSIIFTTRYGLDPLERESIELYGDSFEVIQIQNISKQQLNRLGTEYGFALPQNERFLNLLLALFYLNEYLESYESGSELKTYSGFKKNIWDKKIQGSSRKDYIHRRREACFIELTTRRADSGSFYIKPDNLDPEALSGLESDEVVKYDRGNLSYYITHDIYEEWAFNKIIEREFNICTDYHSFLQSFESSLPILRAFRIWLSEQLLFDADKVKRLIEESICDDQVEGFWKDEILISILLSEHPATFFHDFETKLLNDDGMLLKRIIFLLRMACKQIDKDLLKRLGIQYWEEAAYDSAFTMPRGRGWDLTIDFIHKHKKKLGLQSLDIVLPLLSDWNNKFTVGDSTKKASQLGLYYYERISTNRGSRRFRKDIENLIIRVILQGSREIKNELSKIFDEVLAGRSISYSDKYFGLIKTVLCSLMDGIEAVNIFPEYVRRLADLFWFQIPENEFGYFVFNVEHYFCITETRDFTYFPASSYQTPIFQLLSCSPDETIDFIISFVNRAVECYAKSAQKNGLDDNIEEIKLTFNDGRSVKQFISTRLWSAYRGTAVSTPLLESIHMALEKYLLENAPPEVLESQCECILKRSTSASLTAVVASVVCSQPNKLFNVAKTILRTKELFHYDLERLISDQSWKSTLLWLKQISNFEERIHYDERIKACNAYHRYLSLENVAFQYQIAKSKDDPEVEKRKKDVWAILDEHYERLPPESEQTEDDMTWRLSLARMDFRKMIATKQWDERAGLTRIALEPEIDERLKKYSEDSLQRINDVIKFSKLKIWSESRFRGEHKEYEIFAAYEKDPHLAVIEAQEIMDVLSKRNDKDFALLNDSIPAYVCAVLIRDFADVLTDQEKSFCRNVIIDASHRPLHLERYTYQASDGVEPAILSLPLVLKHFPDDNDRIKLQLLFLILNHWPKISASAVRAVRDNLWESSRKDAQSILRGYLVLQPKYQNLSREIRGKQVKKVDQTETCILYEEFARRCGKELEKVSSNALTYADADDLKELGLRGLNTAFELVPVATKDKVHRTLLDKIFPMFAERILSDEHLRQDDDDFDYEVKSKFLNNFAIFVLSSKKKDISVYLKPFVQNFRDSKGTADLLHEFLLVEDATIRYEEFWTAWDEFYAPVEKMSIKGNFHNHASEIIHNYLLAWPWWKQNAREWHSLRDREKLFYSKVAQQLGSCPPVFYSLCKILQDIGSRFLNEGVIWLSEIIKGTPNLASSSLDKNTIYYLERVAQRYILNSRTKIKTIKTIQDAIVEILDFLIVKESATGYLLREHIP